jgi:hypothetical protein
VTTAADLRAAAFLKVVTWARVALVPVILALVLAGPDNPEAFTARACCSRSPRSRTSDGLLPADERRQRVQLPGHDGGPVGLRRPGRLLVVDACRRGSAVIINREIMIIGLKGAVASTGDLVGPPSGARPGNVQFLAIFLAILRPGEPIGPLYLDQCAMIAAAVITVLSGLEYVVRFRGSITSDRDPAA